MKRPIALALWLLGSAIMVMSIGYGAFRAMPHASKPRTLEYGSDPLQHVELWRPKGRGPFPVVLLLHGGCWQSEVAKADIMRPLAVDLMARGVAVWNIEYRGVDVPGGGYPGTFLDVAAAADMLGRDGSSLSLDTRHVVAVGHSAGGHLAFWLAGRARIARTSALWSAHPLKITGVISQGGLPDLRVAQAEAAQACGEGTIDRLIGHATAARADPYADTSADRLLPLGVTQVLFSGAVDTIAPPRLAAAWVAKAASQGDHVKAVVIPQAGHFDLIAPLEPAWRQQRATILAMTGEAESRQPLPR